MEEKNEHQEQAQDEQIVEEVVESEEVQETEELQETVSHEQQLEQEVQELNDKVFRLSAEIANIQKRNAKERQDAAKYRSQALAQNLLSALDNLERALAVEVTEEQALNLKKGIEMVQESILYALKEEGVEEITALGEPFDPNKHHAVQTVPAEEGQDSDIVVQVFQKGYVLKDRVIRPAMVIVSQ